MVGYSEDSNIVYSTAVLDDQSQIISATSHIAYNPPHGAVGGLVGLGRGGRITGSNAIVNGRTTAIGTYGNAHIGGLVGLASDIQISDSYVLAEGIMAARAYWAAATGGLVGYGLSYADVGLIHSSYAVIQNGISSIASHAYAGGMVGRAVDFALIDSYYSARRASSDPSTTLTNAHGFNRSLDQLKCPVTPSEACQGVRTYVGWSPSLWDFGDTRSLPIIRPIQTLDADGDGLLDRVDNCPFMMNPGQNNSDGDRYGDACDDLPHNATEWRDSDADTIGDNADNCDFTANPRQLDYDNDDQGDACDPDIDNDGRVNA